MVKFLHNDDPKAIAIPLVTSFSHNLFKRLVHQTQKKQGLVWEGYEHIHFTCTDYQVLQLIQISALFLGTTPVLMPNVWASEQSQS